MTDEQRRVCLRAIDHFGVDHQKEKAVEELLELGTEIMHDLDGRGRMDAIREELADVIIMAEQLRIIYGPAFVDMWVRKKAERLERMIAEDAGVDPSTAARSPSPIACGDRGGLAIPDGGPPAWVGPSAELMRQEVRDE